MDGDRIKIALCLCCESVSLGLWLGPAGARRRRHVLANNYEEGHGVCLGLVQVEEVNELHSVGLRLSAVHNALLEACSVTRCRTSLQDCTVLQGWAGKRRGRIVTPAGFRGAGRSSRHVSGS
jgi:hypothetical protein